MATFFIGLVDFEIILEKIIIVSDAQNLWFKQLPTLFNLSTRRREFVSFHRAVFEKTAILLVMLAFPSTEFLHQWMVRHGQ